MLDIVDISVLFITLEESVFLFAFFLIGDSSAAYGEFLGLDRLLCST